jgi:SAM-dependent methyltransferase
MTRPRKYPPATVRHVIDDPHRDADLVRLYDVDNPGGEDHAYYRALADEIDAHSIIDLGCGTGLLTRSLAGRGRTVIGVDPSRAMLDYARQQPGSELVTWIHADASALAPTGTADLAICTGNAIMQVTPAELPLTLRSIAAALRPGGVVSFESRNPACRAWEHWTPEATYSERVSLRWPASRTSRAPVTGTAHRSRTRHGSSSSGHGGLDRVWWRQAGRSFLGRLRTTASYEKSTASRSSSSGIAPPSRRVFQPYRPM